MDLFWQITIVEFLLNVAVFAAAVMAYSAIPSLFRHLPERFKPAENIAVGVLFGAATVGALLMPIHMSGGATIGGQSVLLGLAAPIAGPWGALAAAFVSLRLFLFQWIKGTSLEHTAIVQSLASIAAGFVVYAVAARRRSGDHVPFGYLHLPILGVLCAGGVLAGIWYDSGFVAAAGSWLTVTVSSVVATIILGTLLIHEKRRHQAERNLRESEMRLA